MRKIALVAHAEIISFVQTKAFLVSMILMPLLMMGGRLINRASERTDTTARTFAVLDHTHELYDTVERAAAARTATPRFVASRAPDAGSPDETRRRLTDAVRRGEIFAYVEIPADALAVDRPRAPPTPVSYVSDAPTYDALRHWLEQVLAGEVRARRYARLGISADAIAALERPLRTDNMSLSAPATGDVAAPTPTQPVDGTRLMLVPMGATVLLFMLVMIGAPHLLNAVIEEKMSRISEVLLAAVTPFELMMGKLVGAAVVSLGLAACYVGGGVYLAVRAGYGGLISSQMIGYFAVFLVLAMFLYGSIYLAIGAACSNIKEAQSFIMPVVLLKMLPFFLFRTVLVTPGSPLSVGASLVPTATPFLMLMRLGLHPAPPGWQVGLSIALTLAATVACVWAAGRIFRVGLLLQGKPPSLVQMARWVLAAR